MRRRDGTNLWVERAVKVFRTRRHKPQQQLALANDTATANGNGTQDVLSEVLSLTSSQGEDAYQEEMELLFTTRSI